LAVTAVVVSSTMANLLKYLGKAPPILGV
jgi:hypothetical protein